jgi:glucosamine kinase
MPYFLGIDGGGTKTRCILGDEETQIASGSSGSSKVQRVGEACARDSLAAAVHEVCVQAGISPRKIARTCAGITGSARAEIARIMRELMMSIVGGEIEIVGDVEIAFEDAFADGPGVIVIAGTGSIAYGRNPAGKAVRAGGWGYPMSDEGSGYWVGVEALRSALLARDRGEASGLLNELMAALGAKDFEDFIVELNVSPPPDFAALFPLVLSSAQRGEEIARQVLDRAGQELAKIAKTVIHPLEREQSISVAAHGGVFTSGEIVMNSFASELQKACPQAVLLNRSVDPARGALQLARRTFKLARAD